MFAVPGWAVSAATLKPEVEQDLVGARASSKGKKRKRPAQEPEVNAANFAELWEKVIEKKEAPPRGGQETDDKAKESRKSKKRRRQRESSRSNVHDPTRSKSDNDAAERGVSTETTHEPVGQRNRKDIPASIPSGLPQAEGSGRGFPKEVVTTDGKRRGIKLKPEKRAKKTSEDEAQPERAPERDSSSNSKADLPGKPSPASKLTPLQVSMRAKLISARFRHLNETLYTKPSKDASRLFEEDPAMFDDYHAGFRNQVSVWPENPLTGYIEEVLRRAPIRASAKHQRDGAAQVGIPGALLPLPRTSGTCTIADLGCGEGQLASALQRHLQKHKLTIHSYDLHSPNNLVTRADIANLPLEAGSVDVAIFCLALMGTNWLDFIEEAYRVLRWQGELWVAEIKSRFAGIAAGAKGGKPVARNGPVAHSVGARHKASKSVIAAAAEADNARMLAVEVDGEDRQQKTDVTPFVEALRRRGFVLAGGPEEAIDESNKMFVKLTFRKAAPASRGKMVDVRGTKADRDTSVKKPFIPVEDPVEEHKREMAILKPCVYKLR
jgi:ribosomal RNA-processing protein 8